MEQKGTNSVSISVEANSLLDQIPFLRVDPRDDRPGNARRLVVRGVFKPLVYYLLENTGTNLDMRNSLGKMQTPEEIIFAIVTHPSVGLEVENQRALLEEFGPGEHRDWGAIGLAITMRDRHPLLQLSQLVASRLSDGARNRLTNAELTSC
jgi:hypothetical protein